MAKLESLKGSVQVFFTDEATGSRYRAFPDGTFIYCGGDGIEARMRGVLDAQGIDYADEPNPVPRAIYGVEVVGPVKLVKEYLLPALKGEKLPGE